MRHRLIEGTERHTWAVVLDNGDEAVAALTQFARERNVEAAQITAIGAFENAVLGYFDWQQKAYRRIPVDEQAEVVSLIGDVALGEDGSPSLHIHAVLGLADGTTRGGHLLAGRVRPTLEVVLTQSPAYLQRRKDPVSGLALIVP
jgi:predicted DNA-binding protein with PD1-like motif